MHTKSLAVLKRQVCELQCTQIDIGLSAERVFTVLYWFSQMMRRKLVKTAKEGAKQKATDSEVYDKMQEVFLDLDGVREVRSFSLSLSLCLSPQSTSLSSIEPRRTQAR